MQEGRLYKIDYDYSMSPAATNNFGERLFYYIPSQDAGEQMETLSQKAGERYESN